MRNSSSRALRSVARPAFRFALVSLSLSALLLAGCSDDPVDPTPVDQGAADLDAGGDLDGAEAGSDSDGGTTDADAALEVDTFDAGCGQDDACPDNAYCDVSSGACVVGCRTGANLGDGNCADSCSVCDRETRVCVENNQLPGCDEGCGEDADCNQGTWCDAATGACVVGCRLAAEECPDAEIRHCCPGDSSCSDDHICVDEGCAGDTECDPREFCYQPSDLERAPECRDGCRVDDPDTGDVNEDDCVSVWGEPADYVCDPVRRVCDPMVCDEDDDQCPTGFVCDASECRPGCRTDDECGGEPCDRVTNLCRCVGDNSCGDDQVCEDDVCIASCHTNDECEGAGELYCNPGTGHCYSVACPNEDPEALESVPLVPESDALFFGVLCGADVDTFRIAGFSEETLDILVTGATGEIVAQLFGAGGVGGTPVAQSTGMLLGPDDSVQLIYPVTTSGPLVLKLSGIGSNQFDGSATISYAVRVRRVSSSECVEDRFEDDDTLDDAQTLLEGPNRGHTFCPDDAGDYFCFDLDPDERADVTLSILELGENLDLAWFNESGVKQVSVDSGQRTELLQIGPFDDATSPCVHVYGHDGDEATAYDLFLARTTVTTCEPNEEDDDRAHASEVTSSDQTFSDRLSCVGNEDWYAGQGIEGGSMTVEFQQDSAACDILIQVQAPSGTVMSAEEGTQPLKEIVLPYLVTSGSYAVRVVNQGCSGAAVLGLGYSVRLAFTAPVCEDDNEPDDTPGTAIHILDGTTSYQTSGDLPVACPDNLDMYKIEVPRGGTLSAALALANYADGLSLDLLVDDEGELETVVDCERAGSCARSSTTIGIVSQPVDEGTYYLRIRPIGYVPPLFGAPYSLTANLTLDALECIDEGREANNSFDESWGILPQDLCVEQNPRLEGYYCERLCGDDVDYWWIPLSGPSDVSISVDYEREGSGLGTASLYALPSGGAEGDLTLLDTRIGDGDLSGQVMDAEAAIMVLEPGSGVHDLGDTYRFEVDLASLNICQPGGNSSTELARALQLDFAERGRVCDGGGDWYRISMDEERRFTFRLQGIAAVQGLELVLYRPDGETLEQVARQATSGDDDIATIVRSDTWAGDAFLEVVSDGEAPLFGIQYSLIASAQVVDHCGDGLEPNEVANEAVVISGQVGVDLSICPGDDDWFTFSVPDGANRDVTVTLTQSDTSAPIRLELLDSGQTPVGPAQEDTNPTKSIAAEDLTPGHYLIHVSGPGSTPDAGLSYGLDAQLDTLLCDDWTEDDDVVAQANAQLGDVTVYDNLRACDADPDLFAITVTEGPANLSVDVSRANPTVDLQVRLLDDEGVVVAEVAPVLGSDPVLNLEVSEMTPGLYHVEVTTSAAPLTGELYAITLTLDEPVSCTDEYEGESGNDTRGTATDVADPPVTVSARSCSDADYYAFELPLGPAEISASVSGLEPGDLTLTIQNHAGITLGEDGGTGSVTLAARPAGSYFAVVESDPSVKRGIGYTLSIDSSPDGCPVDAFEPNDAVADGDSLPQLPDDDISAWLCTGDDDVYRVVVADPGMNLSVVVQHGEASSAVRVEAVNSAGELLASDSFLENVDPFKGFWVLGLDPGTYFVRVTGAAPELGLAYTLRADLSGGSPCPVDRFESNPSAAQAAPLSRGVEGANMCRGEADWYAVTTVTTSAVLHVAVDSAADGAQFDVALYDTAGTQVLAGCAGGDVQGNLGERSCSGPLSTAEASGAGPLTVVAPDLEAGDYRLAVTPVGEAPLLGWAYSVSLEIQEEGCLNDVHELNETLGSAVELQDDTGLVPLDGRTLTLQMCPGDVDYLRLPTTGNLILEIQSEPLTAYDVEMCLFDSGGSEIECLVTEGLDGEWRTVQINRDVGDYTYYARITPVDALPDVGIHYLVQATASPPCDDDAFEGAPDTIESPMPGTSAVGLEGLGEAPVLHLCPGDSDILGFESDLVDVESCVVDGGDPTCIACEDEQPAPCQPGGGIRIIQHTADVRFEVWPERFATGITVELLDAAGEVIDSDDDINRLPMEVGRRAIGPDEAYFLRITPHEVVPHATPYTVIASITRGCVDDGLGNGTPGSAYQLETDGSPFCAVMCGETTDFFTAALEDGLVRIQVTGDDLLRASVNVFAGADAASKHPTIANVLLNPNDRVFEGPVDPETISLSIASVDDSEYCITVDQDFCLDDVNDESLGGNETQGAAKPMLMSGGLFAICPAETDIDWYEVTLDDDETWQVSGRLFFDDMDNPPDFELQVVAPNGDVLATIDQDTPPDGPFLTDFVEIPGANVFFSMTSTNPDPFVYEFFVSARN